jgi:hypothetical protein
VAIPPRIAPGREDPVMDEWSRTCAFIIGEIMAGQARKGFRTQFAQLLRKLSAVDTY